MLQDEDAEEGNVDQSNPILNASTPNTNESEGDVPSSPTPLMKSGDTKEGIEPLEIENDDTGVVAKRCPVPDMWSWDYVGLYCQYAAVGLLYGSNHALLPLCVYSFESPSNLCANAKNIVTFAWNIKIFFAILTDVYRPFGMRRRPWMIAGWVGVLVFLLILAIAADKISASAWLGMLLVVNAFVMLSDVPADGYSVELGQLEDDSQRGQILATGQRVRFTFCIIAGVIQTLLLNGPSTNDPDCQTSFAHCWSWGLSINGYYGLLFSMVFVLTIPVWWLKELDSSAVPLHSLKEFFSEIWITLQNLTTFYLVIFVIFIQGFCNFTSNANITLQYYLIKLTNFQAGIDTVTTYMALVAAIWIFQRYMIRWNWRYSEYLSVCSAAGLGLLWILAYYDVGGLMNPWFTIFIDLDTNFAQGLSQVLYSLSIIELAKPGQEATTYELVVSVGNAALLLNGIVSTQLLTPFNSVGCTSDDDNSCGDHTVDVSSRQSFRDSNGPEKFTIYSVVLNCISVVSALIFTRFLPRSQEDCIAWKEKGEKLGTSQQRGIVTLIMVVVTTLYGFIAAVLLLDTQTSCLPEVGGSGC